MEGRTVILENGNIIVIPPPEKVGDSIRGYRASKFIDFGDGIIQQDLLDDVLSSFIMENGAKG